MEELLANLKTYLGITDTSEDAKINLMLNQALGKVIVKRYPFGATEEQKALALTAYFDIVFDIALFLYNTQGAEGEKSHSEPGVSRSYLSIDDYLSSIVPVCKFTSADTTTTTT